MSQPTVPKIAAAMAKLDVKNSVQDVAALKELKGFLLSHNSLKVLRHFRPGDEIPEIPDRELLARAKIISMDAEWWQYDHINESITELGLVIVNGSDLVTNGTDIKKTLLGAETYHFRPIETCHLINQELNKDSERHALYTHTRLATIEEIKAKFLEILNAGDPIIFVGQALTKNDIVKLKKQWGIDLHKMDSVVHIIDSVTQLAKDIGIHGRVEKEVNRPNSLNTLIEAFNIHPQWAHNAVNDAMHTLLPVLLLGFYPDLYPQGPDDYPGDSSLIKDSSSALEHQARESLDDLLDDVATHHKSKEPPSVGFPIYCYYCDTEEHDAWKCKLRKKQEPCYYCANVPMVTKDNEKFRAKAKEHRTHRCPYEYLHDIPDFSQELKDKLDPSELRALSRAAFARDWSTYGHLMWKASGAGRVGDKQVQEWQEQGELPSEEGNDVMIPGYDIDHDWHKELDEKARVKNALKKFQKSIVPFSDFHPNASVSHFLAKNIDTTSGVGNKVGDNMQGVPRAFAGKLEGVFEGVFEGDYEGRFEGKCVGGKFEGTFHGTLEGKFHGRYVGKMEHLEEIDT